MAEKLRVLQCLVCDTLESLPDFQGHPDDDVLLANLASRHVFESGEPHKGQLYDVDKRRWESPSTRYALISEIEKKSGRKIRTRRPSGKVDTGFDQEFYDARDTFTEDAGKCFQQHNRNPGCPDYMSPKKRLLPDTKKERRDLGLSTADRPATYLCQFCLGGDTEVVTLDGIKPIDTLVGKEVELLIPFSSKFEGHYGTTGQFAPCQVNYFGVQPLLRVNLKRSKSSKVVYATPEHRWVTRNSPSGISRVETKALLPGDRLQPLKAVPPRGKELPVPFAIAQGFVFGDGSRGSRDRRPATLPIYNMEKDGALLPYFAGHRISTSKEGVTEVAGLPRYWKDLPPIRESRSFLLSWMAGYFAADGCVDARGVATISSSKREHLQFVRSAAAICGIGTSPINSALREGFPGREPSALFSLVLFAKDLPEWFWLIKGHKARVDAKMHTPPRDRAWIVDSVEDTSLYQDVYCAVVPGIEIFGLADDLATGNCVVHTLVKSAAQKGAYS